MSALFGGRKGVRLAAEFADNAELTGFCAFRAINGRVADWIAVTVRVTLMKIFRGNESPFRAADMHSFRGSAETKLLASSDGDVPVHIYHVRFESGARTNWHIHSGPQWLLITEGQVRVQSWGEPAYDVSVGDAVVFAPGEKHWHGAVAGSRGVHLAVNVNVKTEWLEPVKDEDYVRP